MQDTALLDDSYKRLLFETDPLKHGDMPPRRYDAAAFREQIKEFLSDKMNIANISVHDMAYAMAMSERQLYRLAKRLTGCSPARLIKEIKLQKSYELLDSGTINKVEDVARQVGYEDASYFSRLFYQRFGKRVVDFYRIKNT